MRRRPFDLIDPDRLTVGNIVRHPGGISQVGRLKIKVDARPDSRKEPRCAGDGSPGRGERRKRRNYQAADCLAPTW